MTAAETETETETETIRLVISGRVQGVFYRAWTQSRARERGLAGWVRNRRDGTVEAVLSGAGASIAAMIADCHKGPPAARVSAIDTGPADPPDGDDFITLPTA